MVITLTYVVSFSALSALATLAYIICMLVDRDYIKDIFSN